MSEYEQCVALFKKCGIEHSVTQEKEWQWGASPTIQKGTQVAVGQGVIIFDETGRHVGVTWDDMGHWDPRVKTEKGACLHG